MGSAVPSEPPAPEFRLRDRFLAVVPVLVAFVLVAAVAVRLNTPEPHDHFARTEAEVLLVRHVPGSSQPGMQRSGTRVDVLHTVDGREYTSTVRGALVPVPEAGDRITVAYDPAEPGQAVSPALAEAPPDRAGRLAFTAYFGAMVFMALAFVGYFAWENPNLWRSTPHGGKGRR